MGPFPHPSAHQLVLLGTFSRCPPSSDTGGARGRWEKRLGSLDLCHKSLPCPAHRWSPKTPWGALCPTGHPTCLSHVRPCPGPRSRSAWSPLDTVPFPQLTSAWGRGHSAHSPCRLGGGVPLVISLEFCVTISTPSVVGVWAQEPGEEAAPGCLTRSHPTPTQMGPQACMCFWEHTGFSVVGAHAPAGPGPRHPWFMHITEIR